MGGNAKNSQIVSHMHEPLSETVSHSLGSILNPTFTLGNINNFFAALFDRPVKSLNH